MEEGQSRPAVRRTYGSSTPRPRPSSSLIFDLAPPMLDARSSSPPSSTAIRTPPPLEKEEDLFLNTSPSPPPSPLQTKRKATVQRDAKPATVQSTLRGFFAPAPTLKRPLEPTHTVLAGPSTPSRAPLRMTAAVKGEPGKTTSKRLEQTRLTHLPLLHTCKECQMSFVRGSEDEAVHQRHHARVVRGLPWEGLGKGKGKAESGSKGWKVVQEIDLGKEKKGKGKVIVCDGLWGGPRLQEILETVDTVLSAPPLSACIIEACRVLLLVTSDPPPSMKRQKPSDRDLGRSRKERVIGVVVSQAIKTAMRVLREGEELPEGAKGVDSGGGVVCDPEPLPTGLGIHRLFTVPAYRGCGLAQALLDAASRHTVYGCTFDPTKGEVAFSQPTESGRAVMEKWGRGAVRVFVDDERQL